MKFRSWNQKTFQGKLITYNVFLQKFHTFSSRIFKLSMNFVLYYFFLQFVTRIHRLFLIRVMHPHLVSNKRAASLIDFWVIVCIFLFFSKRKFCQLFHVMSENFCTNCSFIKGGLILESFLLWLKSPKKGAKSWSWALST